MKDVDIWADDTQRRLALAASGVLALALSLCACATKPVPRAAEVPIDQFTTGPAPASGNGDPLSQGGQPIDAPSPGDTVAATNSAPPTPLSTPTPSASGGPTPLPVPPIAVAGAHPPPSKGQKLTVAQCGQLMDKYIVLVGVANGLTLAQAQKGLPTMKAQAQTDPNMANAETACVAQNSKKQYACAMKATSVDTWKACLE